MQASPAVAGLLVKGQLSFNLLTIFEEDIPLLAKAVHLSIQNFIQQNPVR